MSQEGSVLNIAGYFFTPLDGEKLQAQRMALRQVARDLAIKGTILLTPEGINCFLAGPEDALNTFLEKHLFVLVPEAKAMSFRKSWSKEQPFSRMLVKYKGEIIAFGQEGVDPSKHTVEHLSPAAFKAMYENGEDMLVLDTRNDYEYKLGTFKDALCLPLENFRDFPEVVAKHVPKDIDKPIVMFCTGGVRCEKAGEWMRQAGYKDVKQLHHGILGYFEECGSEHYDGECFVFDKRVGVGADLAASQTRQCFDCRTPVTQEVYVKHEAHCPSCGSENLSRA